MARNHQSTQTLAGSEERIRVLQARVAARQSTTSPADRSTDHHGIPVHHNRNGWVIEERRPMVPLLVSDQAGTPAFRNQPLRFSTVLRLARKAAGLSQHELSKRAGLYRARIDEWERAVAEPTVTNVVALATGLVLPFRLGDWQIGLTDPESDAPAFRTQPKKFSTILSLARNRAGLSLRQLGKRAGLHYRQIGFWENGAIQPTLGNVVALSVGLNLPLTLGTWVVTV